jgi:hypothetical protein
MPQPGSGELVIEARLSLFRQDRKAEILLTIY